MKSVCLALLPLFIASCSGSESQLKVVGNLSLKEVSGLEYVKGTLWALEDSGNKNSIYKLSPKGKIVQEVVITNAKNTDWEELTSDKNGNLYIGDFGNNDSKRKDLAIYKLDASNLNTATSVIKFYYPEQREFPPKKSNLIYDCEAFFEHEGNFYLFTKNRSKGFNGEFQVYKVPNKQGNHAAQLLGTLTACNNFRKCAITGADISPDGTKVALISGDKVWLITGFGKNNFAKGSLQMLELNDWSQKEGIAFIDNDVLTIADEKSKKEGGKLYEVKLSDLLKAKQ